RGRRKGLPGQSCVAPIGTDVKQFRAGRAVFGSVDAGLQRQAGAAAAEGGSAKLRQPRRTGFAIHMGAALGAQPQAATAFAVLQFQFDDFHFFQFHKHFLYESGSESPPGPNKKAPRRESGRRARFYYADLPVYLVMSTGTPRATGVYKVPSVLWRK